jgi:hypothetical protein
MKIILSVLALLASSPFAQALAETSQQDQVVTATASALVKFIDRGKGGGPGVRLRE